MKTLAKLLPERRPVIIDTYRLFSVKETARLTGHSPDTVRAVLREAGILRPCGGQKKDLPPITELRDIVRRIGSVKHAAQALGVHPETLTSRLKGAA